jgi:hypothetical protein
MTGSACYHRVVLRWVSCAAISATLGCRAAAPVDDAEDTGSSGPASTSTAAAETTGGTPPGSPTPACLDYVACVETTYPDLLGAALDAYGPDASCWSDAARQAECDATCQIGLDQMCSPPAGGTGEPGPPLCSLGEVAPGVPSPVEAGADVGLLPPPIGAVFEAHCGCHLVDDPALLVEGTPPYLGALGLRTWADVQAPFKGQPAWREIERRSIEQLNMPPTYHCDPFEFGSLPADDYATLQDWLSADAPDGADWPP